MNDERKKELERLCLQLRKDLIHLLYRAGTGHPGGSLSCCEIITVLYQEIMNVDPAAPMDKERDHFILSKGHAAPMLYLNLAKKGFFDEDELKTFRQTDSRLQGHPCAHKLPGVEVSTGPLGLGLGAGLGLALADALNGRKNVTYVLMGDGEIQEGAVWEAAMAASKYRTARLVAVVDANGVQLDGPVERIMPLGDVRAKWEAFGWMVLECDGHDVGALFSAFEKARGMAGSKPVLIIAKTVKGKGISFMEGKSAWHGKAILRPDYERAVKELEEHRGKNNSDSRRIRSGVEGAW